MPLNVYKVLLTNGKVIFTSYKVKPKETLIIEGDKIVIVKQILEKEILVT